MARTKMTARKTTGGNRGFHQRARLVGSSRRLYAPRLPNTFIVPAVDPYHIRVHHREAENQPEINQTDYEPLDGPNSDESEEDTIQHSQTSQITEKTSDNSVATGYENVFSQELIRGLDAE